MGDIENSKETTNKLMKETFRSRQKLLIQEYKSQSKNTPQLDNAFIYSSEEINFTTVFSDFLQHLDQDPLPDFFLIRIVRYLFTTPKFSTEIMSYVSKVPLWLSKGEHIRTYWSENHTIMFTSTAFLLRQKFGKNATIPADESLKERLIWYLNCKIKHGFYEYYSNVYMPYTLGALLNLFDFSQDQVIKNLAKQALDRFFMEWIKGMNSSGHVLVASGRSNIKGYVLNGTLYSSKVFQVMSLATGKNFNLLLSLVKSGKFNTLTLFLAHTFYDPTRAVQTYETTGYYTLQVGLSKKQEKKENFFANLSFTPDRYTSQWSMGAYSHPSWISDTFRNVHFYDLWNHSDFRSYKIAKRLPYECMRIVSTIGSSLTEGSLVDIKKLKIWKNDKSVLSSVEKYFPGYKGYQQVLWTAVCDDVVTLSTAVDVSLINSVEDINKNKMNTHLPLIKQEENVALILYNPRRDLELLGYKHIEVALHFNFDNFDESSVEIFSKGTKRWFFGRKNDSYIALYIYCENMKQIKNLQVGYSKKQMYVVIVGNKYLYNNYEDFILQIKQKALIQTHVNFLGISGRVKFEGKIIKETFVTDVGNF
eukprot:maker-scaffold_14-snap-gene-4.53-mRNA-1 protein AED:0.04 eAED:0.04 QI:118/0.83/0.71/1/0.83/0.71/7/0/589